MTCPPLPNRSMATVTDCVDTRPVQYAIGSRSMKIQEIDYFFDKKLFIRLMVQACLPGSETFSKVRN